MRTAFTLIEQLAAVALASAFMLAGFAVLGRLSHRATPQPSGDEARALRHAADLIAWDLSEAARLHSTDSGLNISGFGSLDAAMNPTHRPVRIEYKVEHVGSAWRLVRRQTSLDVMSNRGSRTDWVADGIARIELTPLSPVDQPTTRPAPDLFGPNDAMPLSEKVQLTLVPTDSNVAPVRRICVAR
jgi:hypothetical protein